MFEKKIKIGLVLGGGGPKGLAHIGVIRILEENNIPIDFIVGTSIGAMIGGFYAKEKDIRQVEKMTFRINKKFLFSLLDPSISQGLLGGKKVVEFIKKQMDSLRFKDLKIPLFVVATNLKDGNAVVMNEGDVTSAIRASISLPLIFKPIKRKGMLLCDGGLSLPVPVEVAKKNGADLIIAVNLEGDYFNDRAKKKNKLGFYRIYDISNKILIQNLSSHNVRDADLVINPKVGNTHWKDLLEGDGVILAGESATLEVIPQLKKMINEKISISFRERFKIFMKNFFKKNDL